jgi:arginyl-tRNA synthetase
MLVYLTRDMGGAIERFEDHAVHNITHVLSAHQDLRVALYPKVLQLPVMGLPWADWLEDVRLEGLT